MSEDQQSLVARPYLSRRARACKQCRSAKVRCSGGRPCERCTRRRDPCAFISDENYVSAPEQYLRDLQRQLSELQATIRPQIRRRRDASPEGPRLQSPGVAESASDPSPHPHPAPSVGAPTTRPTERQAFPPSSSISADLGTPSSWPYHTDVTAPNISNSRLTTSTTPSSTSRDPVLANDHGASRPGRPRSILVRNDFAYVQETHARRLYGAAFRLQWQAKSQVDAGDIANLPPMDHAFFLYHTVRFRLGELFRMIDEPRFLGPFEDFHRQPLQTAQEHRLWFVEYLLILAFGKALTPSRGPTANGPPGCELATRALSLLPDVAFLQDERPAVQAIEVLSLAALYFYAIDMRSPAYQYIGQALRLALHDGLHRRVPDDVGPGPISVCRNAWWGVYVLDQEITAALGCPSAVPQSDITTPLPDAVSSEVSAKALSLRTRLSRLVSNISSCTKRLLSNRRGVDWLMHSDILAELWRDTDEITSAYKTGGGEPPHMFYNITLSHHHCIVLATRPLVIWLLLRSVPPTHFEPRLLTGPVATLLEKSAQSATRILLTLKDLADREILEGFLPFQLEHAFSSAVLLCILSVFLPRFVPNSEWRQAVTSVFEAMIAKGNVAAGLRTAELEHLETLLGHHRPPDQILQRPVESDLQRTSFGAQSGLSSGDLGPSQGNHRQLLNDFTLGRDDTRGDLDLFDITADDILALAQEFEHDDPSTWIIFDERG
ncbi:Fungal specific transcription factor domain-containing [Fusarium albosuccineum]|uniref:Fungal specific transcription factor domain-containing n=1 Tax=Fusarium albosuccineum TaxID=1237068 RepID=A0A8H4LME9_9HYPO|nr:Fungal specific transcription factor domain-containing [Fusarium albosuccineum]